MGFDGGEVEEAALLEGWGDRVGLLIINDAGFPFTQRSGVEVELGGAMGGVGSGQFLGREERSLFDGRYGLARAVGHGELGIENWELRIGN